MKKLTLALLAFAAISYASEYVNPYWFEDGEKETIKPEYIKADSNS
ncbi:hypothetical protein [Nitrosophilus kaiyonis]|nr:hypothetical protein [Nitrosophilus kaiyonis]